MKFTHEELNESIRVVHDIEKVESLIEESEELLDLKEALQPFIAAHGALGGAGFKPQLHPRNRRGEFRDVLGKLLHSMRPGEEASLHTRLPSGGSGNVGRVARMKNGRYVTDVGTGRRATVQMHDTPEDMVRHLGQHVDLEKPGLEVRRAGKASPGNRLGQIRSAATHLAKGGSADLGRGITLRRRDDGGFELYAPAGGYGTRRLGPNIEHAAREAHALYKRAPDDGKEHPGLRPGETWPQHRARAAKEYRERRDRGEKLPVSKTAAQEKADEYKALLASPFKATHNYHPGIMDLTDPNLIQGERPIARHAPVRIVRGGRGQEKVDPLGKIVHVQDEHGNVQSVWRAALEPRGRAPKSSPGPDIRGPNDARARPPQTHPADTTRATGSQEHVARPPQTHPADTTRGQGKESPGKPSLGNLEFQSLLLNLGPGKHEIEVNGVPYTLYYDLGAAHGDSGLPVSGDQVGDWEVWRGHGEGMKNVARVHVAPHDWEVWRGHGEGMKNVARVHVAPHGTSGYPHARQYAAEEVARAITRDAMRQKGKASPGRTTARDYLEQEINYGGEMMPRGEVMKDLERIAKTHTDDPAQQRAMVDRYMQGAELRAGKASPGQPTGWAARTDEELLADHERLFKQRQKYRAQASRSAARRTRDKNSVVAGNFLMSLLNIEAELRRRGLKFGATHQREQLKFGATRATREGTEMDDLYRIEDRLEEAVAERKAAAEAGDTERFTRALAREDALRESALSAKARKSLPKSAFVFPDKAPGSGSYPIHDLAHARNALARASGKPEEAAVRAAVYKRYPQLRD